MTDTSTFYGGSENWEVPEDPTQSNLNLNQPPYYLTLRMPGQSHTLGWARARS